MSSTTTPSWSAPLPGARIAAALNDDWHRLLGDAGAQSRSAAWRLPGGSRPGGLAEVLDAVGGDRERTDEAADPNLGALVAIARHDELAARVVVQRLVPGLVHAARRRRYLGAQAAFDELVGTAWLLVRTYPIERRPTRVAANLCRDAEYEAFVRPRRLRSSGEEPHGALHESGAPLLEGARPGSRRATPVPAGGMMISGLPATDDELRTVLVDARRAGVAPARLALLVQLHLLGRHPRALAEELRVSERTVRLHRDATVRQLARLDLAA